MPKGYVVARIEVTNPDTYAVYAAMATEVIQQYGGRVLVRGGRVEAMDGQAMPRNVIVEFDSFEAARNYYTSPEYSRARAMRLTAGIGDVVVVEGV